jgi:2-keto-4-pentenoate hydratase/2-oxohepta-3-ene-1,7-dioic acid hydratase in catechol pathway
MFQPCRSRRSPSHIRTRDFRFGGYIASVKTTLATREKWDPIPIVNRRFSQVRQAGDLADMIWSVADIIAILSTYVAVAAGDLIFTGTPAGVGPIQRGEQVRGAIAGIDPVEVTFE